MTSWLRACGIGAEDSARYASLLKGKGCDKPDDLRDLEVSDWPDVIKEKPLHFKKIRKLLQPPDVQTESAPHVPVLSDAPCPDSAVDLQLVRMQQLADEADTKILRRAEGASVQSDKALHVLGLGIQLAAKLGEAVPVFGPVAKVAGDLLKGVEEAKDVVDDAIEMGRRVLDWVKLLVRVARRINEMRDSGKRELEEIVAEIKELLEEVLALVDDLKKPGFVRKAWQVCHSSDPTHDSRTTVGPWLLASRLVCGVVCSTPGVCFTF